MTVKLKRTQQKFNSKIKPKIPIPPSFLLKWKQNPLAIRAQAASLQQCNDYFYRIN